MHLNSRKKIKIGVVGPSWPFRGGIAKFTTQLAENLARKGHLASFITPSRQYPNWLFPGKTDRDEKACKKLRSLRPLYSYYQPWTWAKVIRDIEKSNVDCVVVPHWSLASAPFLSYLTRRTSKPIIPIVHNFVDHDSVIKSRRFTEWTLKKGSAYIHHNPEYFNLKFFKQRADRVKCQLHPVSKTNAVSPIRAKSKFNIPEGLTVFLFYGLIRPYKGLETLLEAIEYLSVKLPIAFLIAGEPWAKRAVLQKKIERLSEKFWIHSNLNWIPEQEAAYWFTASDAVVCPYLKATGSGVVAQALSYKKPVLTTDTGSLKYVVNHGVNGLLCPPNSPKALAKNIEIFLEKKVRDQLKMGSKSSRKQSWDEYVSGLIDLAESSKLRRENALTLN